MEPDKNDFFQPEIIGNYCKLTKNIARQTITLCKKSAAYIKIVTV